MEYLIIYVLFLHFVGDFICQWDEMSKMKSKSNLMLALHVSIVTFTLFAGLVILPVFGLYPFQPIGKDLVLLFIAFAAANGLLHFIIDYCTSRATSYLWSKGDTHNFFVVIGLDQFLHMACYIILIKQLLV